MGSMVAILYRSEALATKGGGADAAILHEARERNASCSVTGFLYRESNIFYQWLEGPAAAVTEIFTSIAADPRHHDIHKLGEFPITGRSFPSWSMGYERNPDVSLFDWAAENGVSLLTVRPEEILRFLLHCAWRE